MSAGNEQVGTTAPSTTSEQDWVSSLSFMLLKTSEDTPFMPTQVKKTQQVFAQTVPRGGLGGSCSSTISSVVHGEL